MDGDKVNWEAFLPTEPLADTGAKTFEVGQVWVWFKASAMPAVALVEAIDVESGDALGICLTSPRGSFRGKGRYARLIRHADGRWAEGYSTEGPVVPGTTAWPLKTGDQILVSDGSRYIVASTASVLKLVGYEELPGYPPETVKWYLAQGLWRKVDENPGHRCLGAPCGERWSGQGIPGDHGWRLYQFIDGAKFIYCSEACQAGIGSRSSQVVGQRPTVTQQDPPCARCSRAILLTSGGLCADCNRDLTVAAPTASQGHDNAAGTDMLTSRPRTREEAIAALAVPLEPGKTHELAKRGGWRPWR